LPESMGDDFDFAEKPVGSERGRQIRAQHFDRHLARVPEVFGQVDRGHAASSQLADDAVATLKGCVQALDFSHVDPGRVPVNDTRGWCDGGIQYGGRRPVGTGCAEFGITSSGNVR
jgi:hypothetical protein